MPTRTDEEDRKQRLARVSAMPDEEIDTSDAPETTDWSDARRGLFKPVKKRITIMLDADLIEHFRRLAKGERGYQTAINAALRDYIRRKEEAA